MFQKNSLTIASKSAIMEMIGGDGMKLESIDRVEAFRYMGQRGELTDALRRLAEECEARLLGAIVPRFVYAVFDLEFGEGISIIGTPLALTGESIREHLGGCGKCVLMAATLGAGADSVIREFESTAVERAFVSDALASAAIEQVCDLVARELRERLGGYHLTWRFSPGYGDLPLAIQSDFLAVLNAQKRIGLTVTDDLILIPRKSVTAILGVSDTEIPRVRRGCASCDLRERCEFRVRGERCGG